MHYRSAGACQVHHTTHKARGGKTSATDCVLLCPFHHQIVIAEPGDNAELVSLIVAWCAASKPTAPAWP